MNVFIEFLNLQSVICPKSTVNMHGDDKENLYMSFILFAFSVEGHLVF